MESITRADKDRARGDIRRLNGRAKENLAIIRIRVRRLITEGSKEEAIKMLKDSLFRFEGADAEDDLRTLLEETER